MRCPMYHARSRASSIVGSPKYQHLRSSAQPRYRADYRRPLSPRMCIQRVRGAFCCLLQLRLAIGCPRKPAERYSGFPLARISHTIFARSGRFGRRFVGFSADIVVSGVRRRESQLGLLRGCNGSEELVSVGLGMMPRLFARCGAACQAGEPRALAAALRRMAALPQAAAAGQLDAIAILMRRTLTRTSAPILSSLRRMVPQVALANGV